MSRSTRNGFVGLIGLGVVLCILGTLMGGKWAVYFDRGRPHPLDTTPKTLEVSEQLAFEKLDIDVSMASVRVVAGDAFKIDARYDNGQTPRYELKDNTLRVYDDGATRATVGIDVRPYKPGNTVSITLPRGKTLRMLSAESGMGDLTIQDVTTAGLTAHASMGDVSVSGNLAGHSEITSDMGEVTVSGEIEGNLKLVSHMGDVSASGELAADCEFESGMGEVKVNTSLPRACYTLMTHVGMGEIHVRMGETSVFPNAANQPDALHTMSASSDMGDVVLTFGE